MPPSFEAPNTASRPQRGSTQAAADQAQRARRRPPPPLRDRRPCWPAARPSCSATLAPCSSGWPRARAWRVRCSRRAGKGKSPGPAPRASASTMYGEMATTGWVAGAPPPWRCRGCVRRPARRAARRARDARAAAASHRAPRPSTCTGLEPAHLGRRSRDRQRAPARADGVRLRARPCRRLVGSVRARPRVCCVAAPAADGPPPPRPSPPPPRAAPGRRPTARPSLTVGCGQQLRTCRRRPRARRQREQRAASRAPPLPAPRARARSAAQARRRVGGRAAAPRRRLRGA